MRRELVRSAASLVGSFCVACFIPYGGDLESPTWNADGKEVFYL